jgi:hypothetical protein
MRIADARSRWLGVALPLLAARLVVLSLLGPLVAHVTHWRIRPTILNELYDLDMVSLVRTRGPRRQYLPCVYVRREPWGSPAADAAYMAEYVAPDHAPCR